MHQSESADQHCKLRLSLSLQLGRKSAQHVRQMLCVIQNGQKFQNPNRFSGGNGSRPCSMVHRLPKLVTPCDEPRHGGGQRELPCHRSHVIEARLLAREGPGSGNPTYQDSCPTDRKHVKWIYSCKGLMWCEIVPSSTRGSVANGHQFRSYACVRRRTQRCGQFHIVFCSRSCFNWNGWAFDLKAVLR